MFLLKGSGVCFPAAQVLHNPDDGPSPAPRRQSQGTSRHREDGDSEGPGEGTRKLRDRQQLFGGTRLQVNGTHVLRTCAGDRNMLVNNIRQTTAAGFMRLR